MLQYVGHKLSILFRRIRDPVSTEVEMCQLVIHQFRPQRKAFASAVLLVSFTNGRIDAIMHFPFESLTTPPPPLNSQIQKPSVFNFMELCEGLDHLTVVWIVSSSCISMSLSRLSRFTGM